jgi:hypothetical protein
METLTPLTLILELLKTWQVIAVAIVTLAYWGIVSAVSNSKPHKPKPQKTKTENKTPQRTGGGRRKKM